MMLLGIDIGTTHCKAGVFAMNGAPVCIASRPTSHLQGPGGRPFYDPDDLWATVVAVVREALAACQPGEIAAVGVASMAETGLLVDRRTGAARYPLLPWFDTSPTLQAERLSQAGDPIERFCKSGIRPNFKAGLAKLLWLKEDDPGLLDRSVWLGAADWAAFRLTGVMRSEYSLAGRTYAFDIAQKQWDAQWLESLGIDPQIFPPAGEATDQVGNTRSEIEHETGLPAGIPVFIAGHDHLAAAYAAGATRPALAFDSMGTAEALLGTLEERSLGAEDYNSGLSYGCHTAAGRLYWMAGLSSSGGSVEWLRGLFSPAAETPLAYDQMEALMDGGGNEPGEILFFPYLAGSGSPHTDLSVRGAFIGLNAKHTRGNLFKAVFEGTAYEMEFARQVGERVTGNSIQTLIAAGGSVRNRTWLQIKADVSGVEISIPNMPEATLLGACLLAGVGCGVYRDEVEAQAAVADQPRERIYPDMKKHQEYQRIYQAGYLGFQEPLRRYFQGLSVEEREEDK